MRRCYCASCRRVVPSSGRSVIEQTPASRQEWQALIQSYKDQAGRVFHYVHVPNPGARALVVHFSAFFGEWGDRPQYRLEFQGHFHRLKLLGGEPGFNWLFICDEYGADRNGTYYTGERGDFYVERAVEQILEHVLVGDDTGRLLMIGSSMGATAALKFGLRTGALGVVAVSPHIDLDICAATQHRMRHVNFICPDGNALAEGNFPYTRQIRNLLESRPPGSPLPRLFVQSCRDDHGVFTEQVLPLVDRWRKGGGMVDADLRDWGGHTSAWATKALLLDVLNRMVDGRAIDVGLYQSTKPFLGDLRRPSLPRRLLSPMLRLIPKGD